MQARSYSWANCCWYGNAEFVELCQNSWYDSVGIHKISKSRIGVYQIRESPTKAINGNQKKS